MVKSLATRYYRLTRGHAPTGISVNCFGYRADDKYCWCGTRGRTVAQRWEHLFCQCSRWKDQNQTVWKEVGKPTGWKAGRCRPVQICDLFFVEQCDQAVMNFLVATEVREFLPS